MRLVWEPMRPAALSIFWVTGLDFMIMRLLMFRVTREVVLCSLVVITRV